MRAFKAVVYPIAGILQFVVASHGSSYPVWFSIIGVALIGLGILNLYKLIETSHEGGSK